MNKYLLPLVIVLVAMFFSSLQTTSLTGFAIDQVGSSVIIGGEVTPPEEPPTPPIGGDDGGIGTPPTPSVSTLSSDKDVIKVSLFQGESTTEFVKTTNTGNTLLNLNVEFDFPDGFLAVAPKSYTLSPGFSQDLSVLIKTQTDTPVDVYTGDMFIKANGVIVKIIYVIVEVKKSKVGVIEPELEQPSPEIQKFPWLIIIYIIIILILLWLLVYWLYRYLRKNLKKKIHIGGSVCLLPVKKAKKKK